MLSLDCGILLKQICDAIEKRANLELKAVNITLSQMRVLAYLEESKRDVVPLKEIENFFSIAQSTVAGIIKRLAAKDFLIISTDEEDRRVKNVSLSEKGMECCRKSNLQRKQMEQMLLVNLTEEEKKSFITMLNKVYNGISDIPEQ